MRYAAKTMDRDAESHAKRERHSSSSPRPPRLASDLIQRMPTPRPINDRAKGVYIWDTDGKRYIDASSGPLTCTIGHGNERVLAAMAEQAARVSFAYPYQFDNEASESYAQALAAQLPPP